MSDFNQLNQEPEVLSPEQKKAIAKRRLFVVIIVLCVIGVILCGWALVERFIA
ncbi:MAG: hypothetical protein K6B51_01425 [Bacilli bacterium]|jgi:hypothetical protein|nr:hypothetical protein [Bacilli bacterium]MCR5091343.1 hypothetical protein [Bacilli bacterium]MEE3464239.1 hypothetical protein [Candidatus Enteromonas sp.]